MRWHLACWVGKYFSWWISILFVTVPKWIADEVTPDVTEDFKDGLQLLLDEGYTISEAIDLEQHAQVGEVSNFWEAVVENDSSVAEERRHGETSWISPLCLSLMDLMTLCEKRIRELFPDADKNNVPSYEYFRIQFTPWNRRSQVGKRYYGRFDVKFVLQKQTLHKSHVDQHVEQNNSSIWSRWQVCRSNNS